MEQITIDVAETARRALLIAGVLDGEMLPCSADIYLVRTILDQLVQPMIVAECMHASRIAFTLPPLTLPPLPPK
jgi:hypothetical protein